MRKYKVEYLPSAVRDMVEIAEYISGELGNPDAAVKLATRMTEAGDALEKYPYKNKSYHPIKELKYEYRRVLVGNYGMYYWIDEEEQIVTVARVIYQRRNIDELLD